MLGAPGRTSKWAEKISIANAAAQVLIQRNAEFMAQLGSENARAHLIDPPVVFPVGKSLTDRLDLPIRLGLALVAGVALGVTTLSTYYSSQSSSTPLRSASPDISRIFRVR